MEKQKRFQKKTLNSDDHKNMERGAKALKRSSGIAVAAVLFIKNKDNLKKLGGQVVDVAAKVIKR